MSKYDDIIRLPHHVSRNRPQMSMRQRAAQFSSFAALAGHGAAIAASVRAAGKKDDVDRDCEWDDFSFSSGE